jgi:hypothetical protein
LRKSAAQGRRRFALAGGGELAEIADLACAEAGVEIVGVIDRDGVGLPGRPVARASDDQTIAAWRADVWLVTAISDAQSIYDDLVARYGADRVASIALLSIRTASNA